MNIIYIIVFTIKPRLPATHTQSFTGNQHSLQTSCGPKLFTYNVTQVYQDDLCLTDIPQQGMANIYIYIYYQCMKRYIYLVNCYHLYYYLIFHLLPNLFFLIYFTYLNYIFFLKLYFPFLFLPSCLSIERY